MLNVYRHKWRCAASGATLRIDVEPEFSWAPGTERKNPSREPHYGRSGGAYRSYHGCTPICKWGAVMQPFTTLTSVAVPLDEPNIDTNQLCPSRFNKIPRGPKYAQILFHDLRFNPDGSEKEFILNRERYRNAGIIVADRGFGCGSSRETAVYALYEFGIRCVIATSFGDIHASNCCMNGILPVALKGVDAAAIRLQLHDQPGARITVDLAEQTVTDPAGRVYRFDIHPVRKKCLIQGLDEIARTRQYQVQINHFETAYRKRFYWLLSNKTSDA